MTNQTWIQVGAISGALAVAAGAFGAHGLKGEVQAGRIESSKLETFETAARYQMYHAFALIGVGLFPSREPNRSLRISGWAFALGTLLFSGTLYTLAFGAPRWLGIITPFGGVSLLMGWVALAVAAARARALAA